MNNEPVAWMKSNGEVSVTKGEAFCIPLYTHPAKTLFTDAENRDELIGQEFETYLEKLTQDFKEGFREGVLFCEDVAKQPALYGQDTHPAKTLTDEEIYQIAMEVQTGFLPQDDTLAFARAILRKAQEK